jgi:tetratricopeptide (TPR) repeat protein
MLRVAASAAGVALVVGAITADVSAGRLWRDEIGFWTWAVGRYPGEAAYHHSLGAARLRHGDHAGAAEALVAAARLNASLPRVDFNIGLAYTKLGRYDEAVAAYERAVARDSGDVKSLANMGALYERRGEMDRAARAYRAALAVEPRLGGVGARLRVIEARRAARGGTESPTAVGP